MSKRSERYSVMIISNPTSHQGLTPFARVAQWTRASHSYGSLHASMTEDDEKVAGSTPASRELHVKQLAPYDIFASDVVDVAEMLLPL